MDIDKMSFAEAKTFMDQLAQGNKAATRQFARIGHIGRLKLLKLIMVSDEENKTRLIETPYDFAKVGNVTNLEILKSIDSPEAELISYTIDLLKRKQGKTPTFAEIVEKFIDDLIYMISNNPELAQQLAELQHEELDSSPDGVA